MTKPSVMAKRQYNKRKAQAKRFHKQHTATAITAETIAAAATIDAVSWGTPIKDVFNEAAVKIRDAQVPVVSKVVDTAYFRILEPIYKRVRGFITARIPPPV